MLDAELQQLAPKASRQWRFNSALRTIQLGHKTYVKTLSGFPDHASDAFTFFELMEHCYERGLKRPSSYAGLFHALHRSPSVEWSYNGPFVDWFAGGWEQARMKGDQYGRHFVYDINSAYLWSLTLGLPDPHSYHAEDYPKPERGDVIGFIHPGCYLVTLDEPARFAPYPFNQRQRFYVATTDEIETYDLPVTSYRFGVTWSPVLLSTSRMQDMITSLPCAKQTSRSFWGRWASHTKIECITKNKTWFLRNPALHVIWAHLILSRVKLKIWREVTYPKHVYVDSVIVDEPMKTGDSIGDWRLIADYENGINIVGAGMYGPIGKPLDKHIGVKRETGRLH